MNPYQNYVAYIRNVGSGDSVAVYCFDEDWEPIGPKLRHDMTKAGLIVEDKGFIFLKEKAE